MRARVLLGLSLLSALAAPPAPASAFRSCDPHSVGEAPYLCADASARCFAPGGEGMNATVAGVAFFNQIGGSADNVSTGDGGLAGLARVDVDWGVVRAYASADNGNWTTTDPFNESRTYADAQGAFADIGTLVSSTLPIGTPVAITVTMDIHGAFLPDKRGIGQATLTLSKVSNFVAFYLQRDAILFDDGGAVPPPIALQNYLVGDQLIFKLAVVAKADTTNRVFPVVSSSLADMENTGRLLFEIGTPGVTLETMSGHDYTTVPEPASGLLLASAALPILLRSLGGLRAESTRSRRGRRRPASGASTA